MAMSSLFLFSFGYSHSAYVRPLWLSHSPWTFCSVFQFCFLVLWISMNIFSSSEICLCVQAIIQPRNSPLYFFFSSFFFFKSLAFLLVLCSDFHQFSCPCLLFIFFSIRTIGILILVALKSGLSLISIILAMSGSSDACPVFSSCAFCLLICLVIFPVGWTQCTRSKELA